MWRQARTSLGAGIMKFWIADCVSEKAVGLGYYSHSLGYWIADEHQRNGQNAIVMEQVLEQNRSEADAGGWAGLSQRDAPSRYAQLTGP